MTYQFQVGDYIAFNRIIQPEQKVRFKTDYSTGRPIAIPEIPEQVLPQRGQAQIVSLAKGLRRVHVDTTATREKVYEKFTVCRAQAGKPLGVVTVILDDAVLVAKQQNLFEMDAVEPTDSHRQYSTDAKGLA